MSVLIKGMEMPKSCADCPCGSVFAGFKCMACGKQFDKYPLENRMDWCPLVSVPPHGRCIDADALMSGVDDGDDVMFVWAITDAPTIIEAEGGEM